MKAFHIHADQLASKSISATCFRTKPVLRFAPRDEYCLACNKKLKVQKTRKKTIATLHMGMAQIHETILECEHCSVSVGSEELLKLIPYRCTFSYDIITHIGKALFLDHHDEEYIRQGLMGKGIRISLSEINYLARKFIVYLAIAHRQNNERLKTYMATQGGYILHLDATCEGDSPHLTTGLDGISKIVLANTKIISEKKELIIPFLERIRQAYGIPRALVHDMGKGIIAGVKQVFPGVPDFICHFHFLRDIGKDLLSKENDSIRTQLRKHGIQGSLRKYLSALKQKIDCNPDSVVHLSELFYQQTNDKHADLCSPIALYTLILWVLAGKKQGNGFGFPFDRPYLEFYTRLKLVYELMKQKGVHLKKKKTNRIYIQIYNALSGVVRDSKIKKAAVCMHDKSIIFDRLRDAMRIALPTSRLGLRDQGTGENIHTIEQNVKAFTTWLIEHNKTSPYDYGKMIEQIENYWEKLFADPITVQTPTGELTLIPQRTNNILEQFFRDLKKAHCQRTGFASINKRLTSMLPDTPLVKNLENPIYMNMILNGHSSLETRFAEIDHNLVQEILQESKSFDLKFPPLSMKLIKEKNFFSVFSTIFR